MNKSNSSNIQIIKFPQENKSKNIILKVNQTSNQNIESKKLKLNLDQYLQSQQTRDRESGLDFSKDTS